MTKNRSYLITGANAGLGKEVAKQLALIKETEKIFLGCRNRQKADEAKKELESSTGRSIFEVVIMDVSEANSVKTAVKNFKHTIDALILNAGGAGGKHPEALKPSGMTTIAATNLLGHVVLVDELIKADKLNNEVLYVSTEGVRGIKGIMPKPSFKTNSVAEYKEVLNGTREFGAIEAYGYGYTKYIGTLWTSANARKYPQIKFLCISPGNTGGTETYNDLPLFRKLLSKLLFVPIIMPLFGMIHDVEKGARRYVIALNNPNFKSGEFYASKEGKVTGDLVEQGTIFPDLKNISYQDNAYEALHSFIN
jgi:Dehydrogenases with different specificities (related to short-chain alcohol dehydrogenases)